MDHELHQLFDPESSTFTYCLVERSTGAAIVIDSVDRQVERDLALVRRLGLRVAYVVETHAHADHVTGAGALRARTDAQAAAPAGCRIDPADVQLMDGETLRFGDAQSVLAIHTPGHTPGSMCYLWQGHLFTGDTLLIDGCGRTDFQGGDAGTLYDSITQRLFALPDETLVYPGHDYKGRTSSTIGAERAGNPRLAGRTRDEFIALMGALNLPPPKKIDVAVPANRLLGLDVHQA